ncbi:MAG TPA: heparinase II/III family protein, partial [Gemmatimonadaceae bacterium]|nr:heparinase II/III family protein [Gemmatimonadaceae bacterium]
RWLPGRPEHERRWTLAPQSLTVEDRVTGGFARAEAWYHLHPDIQVVGESREEAAPQRISLTLPAGERISFMVERGRASVVPSAWHPEFGLSVPSRSVVVALEEGSSCVRIDWSTAE